MKSTLLHVATLSSVLATAIACATSDNRDEPPAVSPDLDGGATQLPEAGTATDAATDAPRERCSAAGWCTTALPDTNLRLQDVWPLEKHAFATAESDTRGVKVLEWDSTTDAWTYIDDGFQNEHWVMPTSVWAPNDDEVYYSLLDYEPLLAGGLPPSANIYYGKRPIPPATKWTWTMQRMDCEAFGSQPQVRGTGRDDVYATMCGRIYHRQVGGEDAGADGGAPSWSAEYVDDDPASPGFFGITGTSADDVWFVGSRGWSPTCTVLVRRTSEGYKRVADALPDETGACIAKEGLLSIPGALRNGFDSPERGHFIGASDSQTDYKDNNDIVKVAATADGYSATVTRPPAALPVNVRSLWAAANDDIWLIGCTAAGGCTVVRGAMPWSDNANFQYSTLAMNGAPNTASLSRVRGTSTTNLWAVGANRAFHKSTP